MFDLDIEIVEKEFVEATPQTTTCVFSVGCRTVVRCRDAD